MVLEPDNREMGEVGMIIERHWAMPDSNTFEIPPICKLIKRYTDVFGVICDPFVGESPFHYKCQYCNDLNPNIPDCKHMDALDFLKTIPSNECNLVLFDPPYSPRQVSECYKKYGKTVNMATTQSSYWSKLKNEISRIVVPHGFVITCGWNSGGIGKSLGFEIVEILLVAHGGWHNDTIVTVESKAQ